MSKDFINPIGIVRTENLGDLSAERIITARVMIYYYNDESEFSALDVNVTATAHDLNTFLRFLDRDDIIETELTIFDIKIPSLRNSADNDKAERDLEEKQGYDHIDPENP